MTLDELLKTRYVKHGREAPDLDCWGLVRLARVHLFGRDWLPSYSDVDPADKSGLTEATAEVQQQGGFIQTEAKSGTIAAAWRGRLCVHVGLVVETDGRLWILETDEVTGPTLTALRVFESRYTKVIYYDD